MNDVIKLDSDRYMMDALRNHSSFDLNANITPRRSEQYTERGREQLKSISIQTVSAMHDTTRLVIGFPRDIDNQNLIVTNFLFRGYVSGQA